jgi:hypothetical protein
LLRYSIGTSRAHPFSTTITQQGVPNYTCQNILWAIGAARMVKVLLVTVTFNTVPYVRADIRVQHAFGFWPLLDNRRQATHSRSMCTSSSFTVHPMFQ